MMHCGMEGKSSVTATLLEGVLMTDCPKLSFPMVH